MPNSYFQFKQFTIHHGQCAMKVGTDGVLLGAWSDTTACHHILDVGTGPGLIALMLAQRSQAQIDAIDIDAGAYLQAEENRQLSPFAERVQIFHQSLADYTPHCTRRYDLIVSNPPYFVDSLKCPNRQRNTARHTDTLSLKELLHDSRRLLTPQGRIALILPYDQREMLLKEAQEEELFLSKETAVIPTLNAAPKRILVELRKELLSSSVLAGTLTIEIARHQYTEEYIRLTQAFYLKM